MEKENAEANEAVIDMTIRRKMDLFSSIGMSRLWELGTIIKKEIKMPEECYECGGRGEICIWRPDETSETGELIPTFRACPVCNGAREIPTLDEYVDSHQKNAG